MALYKVIHYKEQDDWVFASDFHAGELPLNSKWIQQKTLRPAGKAIGLNFNLGWHTLRHSFKNLLKATGADPEMMRDLMRHSDTHTTTQIYGEVEFDRMQDANKKAVDLAFRGDVKL